MSDRVYPSAKTNTPAPAPAPASAPAKSQIYNPNRIPYRPNATPHRNHRSSRGCLCCCCFWTILTLILLVLLAAIAACAAYLIYSPRRPAFSVAAVRISTFNLTTVPADGTTRLSSAANITLSAKNPNKKQIVYSYGPVALSAYSGEALIATGSLPPFDSYPNDPKILRSKVSSASTLIDADYVSGLKSDLKRRNTLPLRIEMDTKVVVRMGKLKTSKVGIRVICEGIKGILPKGKSVTSSSTTNAKCKVDLRIKIWKFTF